MGMTWDHTKDVARRAGFVTRVVLRVFGRRLNREVFSPTLCRLHETGVIDSRVMHATAHHFDPTQRGVVGTIVQG